MDIANVTKILKVLRLLGQMPLVGEGATRPVIEFYSGVPHSTVCRYLDKMVTLDLVTVTYKENRNCQNVGYYKITNQGIGYVMTDKELFGVTS